MDVFLIVTPSGMRVLKSCDHQGLWPHFPEVALKSHCMVEMGGRWGGMCGWTGMGVKDRKL